MKSPLTCLDRIIRCLSLGSSAVAFGRGFVFLLAILVSAGVSRGQSNQCAALPAGLVAWWSAEGNAADFTGEHSGTFPYGSAFAAGEVGQSFDFDGSFRRVSIADSPAFQLTNAMTLEAWVYPRAYGGFITFRGDNRAGLDNWTVDTYDSGFVKFSLVDPANNAASVRAALALNQWQHIAATWDRTSGDLKIYVNGVLGGQTNSTLIPIGILDPGSEPAIGIGNHGGTFHQFPFNGLIDELGIYSRALASNEIANIYTAGSAGKCVTTNPPAASCVTSPLGLVAWWRAEGDVADSFGNVPGALVGGAGFAEGRVGQAFNVNGDQGKLVQIPDAPVLNLTNTLTFEAWINVAAHSANDAVLVVGKDAPAGVRQYMIGLVNVGGKWVFRAHLGLTSGFMVMDGAAAVSPGGWYHVALTYDGSQFRSFVNGTIDASMSATGAIVTSTSPLLIGGFGVGPWNFNGRVDEVSLYNRALSPAEIQSIINAGTAGKCSVTTNPPTGNCVTAPSGVVGWWPGEGNLNNNVATNTGSLMGGLGFAPGKVGQAFSFNDSAAAVRVPGSPELNVGNGAGFTLEAWINPTEVSQAYPLFEWNDSIYWGVHFYIAPGQPTSGSPGPAGPGQLYANVVDSSGGWHQMGSAAGVITAGVFQHVVLTYDKASGVATIYRNGEIVSQLNLGSFTPLTTQDLYLGRRPAPTGEAGSFAGSLDEPSVYNRALSQAEVQSLYNAGSAGKCIPANPPVSCVPPASDIVGWWRGDNNTLDSIGGNNGVIQGTGSYVTGHVGRAFSFDGVDVGVRIPASPSLDVGLQDGFTAEAWVYPTDVASGRPIIEWSQDSGGSPYGAHLWAGHPNHNPGYFFANIADTQGNWRVIEKEGALVANSYQHVAVTYNRITGIARLFVNGTMVQEANLGSFIPRTSDNLYIGRRPPGDINSRSFAGQIDEASIYRRALNPAEILAIYNAGSAGKCAPTTAAPVITQQPQSAIAVANTTTQFTVIATGVPAPDYQWYFGGDLLVGQTSSTLVLSNVQVAQEGVYAVRVSNASGSVLSSNATLSIVTTQSVVFVDGNTAGYYNDSLGTILDGTAPQFPLPLGLGDDPTFYPADEPNLAAAAALLGNWLATPPDLSTNWRSVSVVPATWELNTETAIIYALDGDTHGVINLRGDFDADNGIYVWVNGQYKFGARAPGLPSPIGQFEYANVNLGSLMPGSNYIQILREDSGVSVGYQVRITGTSLSTNRQPPAITQPPIDQSVAAGSSSAFNVVAIGTPELSYQWRFNGADLADQTNSSLSLPNVQPTQAGQYSVLVSNTYGAVTSSVATLTVLTYPPTITSQPLDRTAYEGKTATFTVQSSGTQPLRYYWSKDGAELAATTATLTLFNVQSNTAGLYQVIVSNAYGSVTSRLAQLIVLPLPPCAPTPEGVIAWWPGQSNLFDVVGGFDGALISGTPPATLLYTEGKVGAGINFLTSPTIMAPTGGGLNVKSNSGLTIEGWIRPDSITGPLPIAEWNDGRVVGAGLMVSIAGPGVIEATLTDTNIPNRTVNFRSPFYAVPNTLWHHTALTYDKLAGVAILYVDGVAVAQTNVGVMTPNTSANVYLGYRPAGAYASSRFRGALDEITLYNRALSVAEIQTIVAADLTGKCLVPPLITQQPQSQAVPLGEDVKLAATVVGYRPLTFRWTFNGTNIPNATNAFLVIEKVKTNNVGSYILAVTNSAGFDISVPAQITLLPAPTCTDILPGLISWWNADTNLADVMGLNNISTYSPSSYPVGKVGAAFTFNGVNSRVAINNNASLNFGINTNFSIELWVRANATNTAFPNVPLLEKRDATSFGWKGYSLSLYNGLLAFGMGVANVSTNALYISSGPDLRDGMFHHVAVTLNRAATNGGVLYVDGVPALVFDARALTNSLLNSASLFIGAPAVTFSNSYFAGLIDEPAIYNRALTAAEILSIRTAGAAGRCKAAPVIVTQPQGGIVALGSNFTLTVVAAGTPAPRYSWRRNLVPINGATNATLNLVNFTTANVGTYSVIVSNAFGSVVSSNAVVALNRAPIANADALNTPSNAPAAFSSVKLTLNDTDADGDSLVVLSVSTNSSQKGIVSLVSGLVTYSPPANFSGNDTFTYTIADGRGGTAVGTVMATVGRGGAAPLNIVFGPAIDAGQFVVRFAGIPGLTYTIEAAPSVNGPWVKVANAAAPVTDTGLGIGVFEFREAVTGEGARYYRTVYPSY